MSTRFAALTLNPRLLGAALLCLLLSGPRAMAAQDDEWHSRLTLYLWLPDLETEMSTDVSSGGGTVTAKTLLEALDFAFMGAFELGRGKWSGLVDLIYLDLSDEADSILERPGDRLKTEIDVSLTGWQVGLYGTYEALNSDGWKLDLLGGARYLKVEPELNLDASLGPLGVSRKVSVSKDYWDGVVGLRGRYQFNDNWYMPFHADVGAGDSDLTYQLILGVGYQFDWGQLVGVYRYLDWDFGSGDNQIEGLTFSGPAVGVQFNF